MQTQTESPAKAQATVSLRISTCHKVQFGEVVKVVGEGEQLGSWDPGAAPGLDSLCILPASRLLIAHLGAM